MVGVNGGSGDVLVSGTGSSLSAEEIHLALASSSSGTLTLQGGGSVAVTGSLALRGGERSVLNIGSFDGTSAGGTFSAAGLEMSGSARIHFNQTDAFAMGVNVTGVGNVFQRGSGTTTWTGNNTFSGSTSVEAGTLVVNGNNSGGGPANVSNGAVLAGSGTIAGAVTVQGGGILAPGNSPGTLTVGSLILNSTSEVRFELGTTSDLVVVLGDLTLDGILNVTDLAGFGIGTYTLFQYGGNLSDNGLSFGTMPAGFVYALDLALAGEVRLNVLSADQYWDGPNTTPTGSVTGGSGTWTGTTTNWTTASGSANFAWSPSGTAIFSGSAGTVNVAETIRVADMVFETDGYVLAGGGQLAVSGTALTVETQSGVSATMGTAITGTGALIKTGADGRLVLTGSNIYTGGTTLASGTLQIGNGGVTGSIVGDLVNDGVLVFDRTNDWEFGGVISGSGSVVKNGAGAVLLSGANTFSGTTQLNAGTLRIGDDSALGTGTLAINGGTLGNDGNGGFPLIQNDIVANADFGFSVDGAGAGLEMEGRLALGTGTRTILFDGDGMVCFGGVISGENLTLLSASGTSDVQFCGIDSNTFSGTLRVGGGVQLLLNKDPGAAAVAGDLVVDALGVAELGGDGQLAATSSVQVDGLLDLLFSTDVAINRLSGSGTVQGGMIGGTLTVQGGNFAGSILEGAATQALAKTGAGTLVLAGANGFTGGTTIDAGVLRTQNQSALAAGPVTINAGSLAPVGRIDIATLTWNGGTVAASLGSVPSFVNIAGNLVLGAGGGGFVFSEGAGYAANTAYGILSAANLGTYTTTNFFGNALGGVTPTFTINGTTLFVSFIGASTGGTLSNYAPVFTPTNADFFVNGQVQTSNAPNTVNSLTFAGGSFLEVFNNLFVTNGNFIVNGGSATIGGSGNVIAPGTFTKLGGGLLNVLTNLFVAGNANIANGGLAVNGTLTANNLFVQLGAWLQGNGVIFGNVFNSGLVAPGNSPGTLSIAGNFTQAGTATLAIELASPTNFDRLIVTGNASLAGTLAVQSFGGFEPEYGQQFAFLQAGSISGSFDTITIWDPSVYRARFLTEGGTGSILIAPASYTLVAETTNQRNVAAALDGFIPATSGDRLTVSLALDMQSAEQYPAAFDQIAPTFYESLANITIEQANAQSQMLAQRMSAVKLGAAGFQAYGMESPLVHDIDGKSVLESKDVVPQSAVRDPQWSTWVQGNGIFAKVVNVSQVPGYRFQSGGFLFGADYAWSGRGQEGPALTTGVFAGYQGTYAKYSGGGNNTINSALFGGYASFQNGGFSADAIVGGGYSNYNVRRPIAFSSIDRTATAKPDGGQFSTYLDAGYDWKAGGFTFGPLVSAQYTYAGIAPFTEDGAGSLNLAVDQQNVNSLRTNIGGRIAYTWNVTDTVVIVPEVRMFWQHEFLNNPRNIGASLDGGSGAGFGYETSTPDRDSIFAGAGVSAQFGERWNGYVYYNADFGRQDYIGQMISTGLNWKF
ncbi:MAG TPA: autotransporter domain-containing protein [Terrimicrobiaceae bacterium]|nr:autotransporter domain-containing protein [Terrimicrobiaceae bacterium]